MSHKKFEFPTNEKVPLKGVDVAQIVDDVVSSLDKLQQAFHSVLDHKYGPALAAILSIIQDLFVHQIMPHITGAQGAEEPEQAEQDKE